MIQKKRLDVIESDIRIAGVSVDNVEDYVK